MILGWQREFKNKTWVDAEPEICTTETEGFFFSRCSDAVIFLLKRGLSKVSLLLTVPLFGAMTQPEHRDAYITEPWQLHTYTNMQTHRVLAPWLLLPGLGPLIFLIAEEQWEGSQSNRPSDSYCLPPNNIAGSRTGRTNLSMSPQKSPAGRKKIIYNRLFGKAENGKPSGKICMLKRK